MKPSGNPSFFKLCLLLVMFVSYTDTYVFSKPRGGQVVSGSASFTQDGNLTVITAGNRSVINYQSFDIGKNETVQFVQPNAHSTVLNRVTTPDPTNIFGHLDANGIVVISNPYGVFFQNGSVVNVGGLIAGAGKVSDADFTAGKIHFTDLKGDVRNDGVIAADNRIALMGANVANTGSLTAAHGVAMMVSGRDVYVGEKNGNIFVRANGRAAQAAGAATSKGGSAGSVSNSGTVAAPRVLLGAGDMYSTAIVNSGLLQGRSIAVNAGKTGSATVGGTLDASSARNRTATGQGGKIDVLGGTVALQGATLDASGGAGGGSIRVGGDFHGAPTVAASTTTTVDAATTIKADATGPTGDGGTVVLWSGGSTAFDGNISARGGTAGGNGGSVEVSSADQLAYRGFADLRASSAGATGSLLLDPANYVIDVTTIDAFGYPADTSIIASTVLATQLTAGNVTLAATNDILFRTDVTANVNANTLTLGAGHSIYIGDPGSNPLGATTAPPASNAALTLGGAFTATYNSTGAVAGVTNARFRMSAVTPGATSITTPGTVTIRDGGVNVGNTPGIIALNITTSVGTAGGTAGGIVLDTSLVTNEPITLGGPLAASGNGGVATNTNGGAVTLTSSGAIVGGTNTITANSTGNGTGGTIGLTANGALTVGDLSARGRSTGVGGNVTLLSAAPTAGAAGAFVTGNLDTSAAGSAGGNIAIGAPAAAGNFRPVSLTVGTITTAGNTATNGGSINLQTSGLLTLTPATPSFTGNTTLFANTTNATSYTTNGYNFSLTLNGAAISASQITDTANNLTLASPNALFGVNLNQNVTTNGSQSYVGVTTVTAPGANVALTAGVNTAASTISFGGTLDDNVNGTHNLTLTPGSAGGTTFGAAVGSIHPLLSLTATTRTTGATTATDQPVTVNGVSVTTTGTQQYGALVLGGAAGALTTLAGSNITSGPVTGNAHPLTVTASGTGTFVGINGAGDVIFNGAGATALNGGITATSLTATGGTGVTTTLPAGASITTTGQQNYNEGLTLGAATTLTGQGTTANGGTALRFGAGIGGAFALTLSNTANAAGSNTLFAAVAGNTVSIGSLSASAVGTTQINNGGITTSAAAGQVYNGPVTLGATTALTANGGGPVNFANNTATLDSAGSPQALTINTTGATTFGAAVGGAPGTPGAAVTTAPALASLNVTGGGTVNVNGGSVTTVTGPGGSQTYSGQVVLGANTTFKGNTATFTGGITSSAAAGNPFNLTLDLASQVTLPGIALTGVRDFASVGSGGVLLNGNVSTYGSQTYGGGGVTIANNVILQAGTGAAASNIVFNTTVQDQTNGAHTLTLNAGASGGVTFNNPVGGGGLALATLTATTLTGGGVEPVTINGVGVTTTGSQGYGTLALGGAAGALTTLTSNGGTGAISSGTVTAANHPLTVNTTGVGSSSTFAAITGAGAVDFEVAGIANFNGAIGATSFTLGATTPGTRGVFTVTGGGNTVATSLGQTYNEEIYLGAATTLADSGTATTINLKGVDSASATAQALTVNMGGTTILGGLIGSINPLASVTTDAPGTTQLNAGTVVTNGAGQVYSDPVTLGAGTTLNAGTGVVTFGQTLESVGTGTAQPLAINTSGATTFGGRVGGAPGGETAAVTNAPALASLTTTGGGSVNVNGGSITTITTAPTIATPTSGLQSYSGQVVVGADTLFKGYALTLTNGITSGAQAGNPFSLTLDLFGPVTLPGSLALTGIRDFASVGPGALLLNGDVTTVGNQTYRNGLITVGANVTLTAGTTIATGSILLGSAVNDQTAGAHTLTLITGTSGGTTIGAAVGNSASLLSLTATARQTTGQPTTADQPVTVNGVAVRTSGSQTYGTLTLAGAAGAATNLVSLGTGLPSTGTITSGVVTGAGHPFVVTSLSAGGGSVFGAINNAGAVDFEVTGTASFNGAITATSFALGTTSPGSRGVFSAGGIAVQTSLGQTYNEPVFLGASETFADTGASAISFKALDSLSATGRALVVSTGGVTTFGGAVGSTFALASVTTDALGSTQINGGSILTNGVVGQVFHNDVTLGANTTLTSSGNGAVTFDKTLGSATTPRALTITTGGLTTLTGQVGGTSTAGVPALASLTTSTGEVDIATGVTTVATSGGGQSYGGPVKLTGTSVNLRGYSLTLSGGLTGQGNALTLDFVTQVGLPGGITGVGAFSTVGAGGALISGAFSAGSQTYSGGPVVLGAASTLTATGGNLTFNVPVDGAFALTLNANGVGGQAVFNANALVGNGTPIGAFASNTNAGTIFNMNAGSSTSGNGGLNAASVAVTGPVTFNEAGSTLTANTHPSILTTGAQTYSGAATLAQDTSLVSSGGGAISFNAAAATINSAAATLHALNTGTTGTQTFTGLIGNTFALGGLTTGTGGTVFNMTLPSTDPNVVPAGVRVSGAVATSGPVTFNVGNSSPTQPSVLTLGGGNQTYGTLTNPVGTAVTLAGPVTVLNSADTASAGTFTGGGTITFNGNIVAGVAAPELDVRAGLGTVVFNQAIYTTGDFAPGGASVIFRGSIGTAANPLGTFTVLPNGGGTGTPLIDLNGGTVVTGGVQNYLFPVVLSANTILTAGTAGGPLRNINFGSTLDGSDLLTNNPYTLTINVNGGTLAFNGIVGGTVPLASLTINNLVGAPLGTTQFKMALPTVASGKGGVNVLGPVAINTAVIFNAFGSAAPTILTGGTYNGVTGTGTQTYNAAATVATDTVLRDLASAGNITFNGKIDAAVDGAAGLSVNAVGDETFAGLIGSTNRLASLSTDAIGTVGGTANFTMSLAPAGTVAGVRTTGLVNVNDRVNFAATGGFTLPTILSGGAQNYQLAATLNTDAVLTAASGDISFFRAVDSASALTPRSLTVSTPGDEIFRGLVGYTTPLFNLTTDATTPATGEAQFLMTRPSNAPGGPTTGGVNVTGNVLVNDGVFFQVNNTLNTLPFQPSVSSVGSQTYNGPAELGTQTILTSTGGNVVFNSTVDSETLGAPQNLTISTSAGHLTTFALPVGGTFPLATLRTTGAGTTQINGGSVTTTGTQLYEQAVTLGQDAVLTSTGSADAITFKSSLDGTRNLTVNAAGTANFAAVGNTSPLLSLSVTAAGTNFTYTPSLVSVGNAAVNIVGALTVNGPVFFDAATNNPGSVTFVRTGVTVAGVTPVPTSAQDYLGAFTLAGTAAFTDLKSGAITFQQTVDGAAASGLSDLTASTGGTISFLNPVGAATPLTSLTTSNLGLATGRTVISGGSVTTSKTGGAAGATGAQTYNDAVFLGAATTLTSIGGGDIALARTLDSLTATPQALTVNTSGSTIFGGAVGASNALASVTTDNEGAQDAGTSINGGSVTTTGAQTYNDTVSLGAATTVTSTGGGNITFAQALDSNSTATPQALTVNTSGQTILGGAVGATFALASLTTDNEGAQDAGTSINGGSVTTTGAQTYNDAVTLGNGAILTSTANGTLVFNDTLDGAFNLRLNTGGQTIFNGPVGGTTPLLALVTDNAGVAGEATRFNMPVGSAAGVVVNGRVTINDAVFFNVPGASLTRPSILTIGNGNQTYNGPASLQTNTFLVSAAAGVPFTGGGSISFTSPQGIASAGGSDLFLRAGVGTTTLGSTINAANLDLGGALVTVAGPVNVAGTFSVEPNAGSGGSILFGGGSVTTTGAQVYNVPLVLGNNTILTSTGGGDITFLSTLDGAYALTLNTSGSEIFGNSVGGLIPLVSLTTDAPAAGQSGGRVIFGLPNGTVATLGVTTTGAQTYNDAALLRTNAVLTSTGGSIAFAQTVDGAFALTLNALGDEIFNGRVGGLTPLASLTTDAPAAGISGGRVVFNIAGSTATLPGVTTSGLQSYYDAATLNTNTVLASTGGGTLTFFSTVDSATNAAPRSLTLDTTGNEVFNGRVGGSRALLSLTTDDPAANPTGGQVIFNVPNGNGVTTTTFQTYNDAVTLAVDTGLVSTGGGALTFASTIDGAFALTLNTTGTTTFQGAVGGGIPLASLNVVKGGGPIVLDGGTVTTTGLQNYGGSATLGLDTVLTSTAPGGGILFLSTVDGARALTLNAVGDETFFGRVGGITPLVSLTTDDPAAGRAQGHVIFGFAGSTGLPSVTTTAFQTYYDDATLQANTALTSTGGGTLTFGQRVDGSIEGAYTLAVNSAGDEVFGGSVGSIASLKTLTTDENAPTAAAGRVFFGLSGATAPLSVKTTGAQTYNDKAVLRVDTTLAATGAETILFNSTVDNDAASVARSLTVNSPGDEIFAAPVGSAVALRSLVTDDPAAGKLNGQVFFGLTGSTLPMSVRTTGAQTFNDAGVVRVDTTLVSTGGGTLTFASTLDSGNGQNPRSVTLNTSGNEVFGGLVGASKALRDLTTDAGGDQGGQTRFNMNLNGQPAGTAGVNVTGAVTVNDTVRFGAPGSSLDHVTVQSAGAQTYGTATLGANTVLASSGGALTLRSTVDGPYALTLSALGTITLSGAVGAGDALASLATLGGPVALNVGTVTTVGAQSFAGAVNLGLKTLLTSRESGIEFGGTVDGEQALTLSTAAATTFDQAVGDTAPLTNLTANDGSAVILNNANVTTLGLQTYGGTLTINHPDNGTTVLTALNDRSREDTTQHGNLVFKQDVNVNSGSLLVQGRRILAQADSSISVAGAGRLDLEASDTLILRGASYGSDSGAVVLNDPRGVTAVPTNQATIFLTNTRTLFRGGSFDMGYLQNMYSLGSILISVPGGVATLSDIAASGSLAVTAGTIVLRARDADFSRGGLTGGTDDGLTFVARTSINFGNTPIRYDNTYSRNNQANFVTRDGLVTVNRDRAQGISIFQDQTLDASFQQRNSAIRFSDDNFATFSLPLQPISGGTQTIDTAAALSGALPDQKPIDVAVDITVTASQMEELKKLGIHPRMAAKQERRSLSSKRALFAQLVDGQDTDNYGMLQPVKGGISRLVPSDYVVVVDRMSEREVQAILTSFEELYGKNKEKVPPIGEAFNTAFTDYTTEKQTADAGGFAPYIQTKPGKYPDVDKAVRGFDSLFGYIESLGLTAKEQEKSKEHIASDLQVSGVSPQDMVKVIDALRSKIPKDQKAPSTKLPPSPPASAPAPGATNPPPPAKKKEAPLKTARQPSKKESARPTARQAKPASEDRRHEVAGL